MGFLTFLKKSKPESASSQRDAGLSIPPPPPFPQTAEPTRNFSPPSSDLPSFQPLDPGADMQQVDLPDVMGPPGQEPDLPGSPAVPPSQPSPLQPLPRFDVQPRAGVDAPPPWQESPQESRQFSPDGSQSFSLHDDEELQRLSRQSVSSPAPAPAPSSSQPSPSPHEFAPEQSPAPAPAGGKEQGAVPEDADAHDVHGELPPLQTPPQIKQQALTQMPVRHPQGAVFVHAQKVAELRAGVSAASDRLRRMGIHIQKIEEQEKAAEQWKLQLEALYRKMGYVEKLIFAGD